MAESRPPTDTKRVVEQKCTLSYATPPLTSEFDEPGPGETGNQCAARVNRVRVRLTAVSQQHTAALRAAGRARIVPGHALLDLAGCIVNIVGEQKVRNTVSFRVQTDDGTDAHLPPHELELLGDAELGDTVDMEDVPGAMAEADGAAHDADAADGGGYYGWGELRYQHQKAIGRGDAYMHYEEGEESYPPHLR